MLFSTADDTYGGSAIVSYDTGSGGKSDLAFFTKRNTAAEPPTEAMRIDDSGFIGIGTTNPQDLFHVANGYAAPTGGLSGGTLGLFTSTASNYADINIIGKSSHGSSLSLGDEADANYGEIVQYGSDSGSDIGRMRFVAGATETMNLKGGKVGIGTSNPQTALHLDSTSTDDVTFLTLNKTNGHAAGKGSWMQFTQSANAAGPNFKIGYILGNSLDGLHFVDDTGAKVVSFRDGGKVGIGSTDPAELLHIEARNPEGGSIVPKIRIQKNEVDAIQVEDDVVGALEFWTNEDTYNPGSGAGAQALRASIQAIIQDTSSATALQFFTGATNGAAAERMRITAAGSVGIGVSPQSMLHIQETTSNTTTVSDVMKIDSMSTSATGVGFGGAIVFRGERNENNGTIQNMAKISAITEVNAGSTMSSGLAFDTATGGFASEKMRIMNTGNVGIGKNVPIALLQVHDDSSTAFDAADTAAQSTLGGTLLVSNNNTGTNSFAQLALFTSESSGRALGRIACIKTASETSALSFVTETSGTPSEKMRILGDGSVGIGTTPGELLHLHKQNAATKIRIQKFESDGHQVADQVIGAVEFWSNDDQYTPGGGSVGDAGLRASVQAIIEGTSAETGLQFFTGNSNADAVERMRIDYTGRIGIGTDSPGQLLHIKSTSASATSMIETSNDGSDATLALKSSDNRWNINSKEGGTFNIEDEGTSVRMTIDTSGKVGIGDTSPAVPLQVRGTIASSVDPIGEDGEIGRFSFYSADQSPSAAGERGYIKLIDDSGSAWDGNAAHEDTQMEFHTFKNRTTDNTAMVIDSDGNVGIGDASPDNPPHITNAASTGTANLKLEQLDDDEPFIRFQGTTASDQTKSLSTDTSVGALTGHIRVSINGTDFWIPYYATN